MHDLLHDLAKYVCGDICFKLEIDQEKRIPKTGSHFSVAVNDYKHFDGFGILYDTKRLHTFMATIEQIDYRKYHYHSKMSICELFSKYKFLCFLSLSYWPFLTKVPDSVGNLKLLYLSDLSYTDIKKLPDSTCSVFNL